MTTTAKTSTKRVRSCIACGKQAGKHELLRIVRTEEGPLFDAQGRRAGRGAYVCGPECLASCQKKNALSRALRMDVKADDYERLSSEIGAYIACEKREGKE